jgi:hypothetical protein
MIFQHVTLPEGKVQELIAEFLDVESKVILITPLFNIHLVSEHV